MWHVFEMRAIQAGVWGVPGGPPRLLDVDATILLAFLEGVVREDEDNSAALDRIYADARPKPAPTAESRAERIKRIERLARMTA